MSTNSEFPKEKSEFETSKNNPYIGRWVNYYYKDQVEDWFKRCIEDFPSPHGGREEWCTWEYYDRDIMDEWYEKWFSQFRKSQK